MSAISLSFQKRADRYEAGEHNGLRFYGDNIAGDIRACVSHLEAAEARVAELEAALKSIASNTCCDKCQEASLVARTALQQETSDEPTS